MTGFAAAEVAVGDRKLAWEIRSVNHRYLDLGFRLPDDLRGIEPELRKRIAESVKRGKVDCTLKLVTSGSGDARTVISPEQLAQLRELEARVLEHWPGAGRLSISEILRWPGMLVEDASDRAALAEPALECFERAVTGLCEAREREGERLVALLNERLGQMTSLMGEVDAELRDAAPRYRDKLRERLDKLEIEVNPERLEQELALIAQRTDVAEEADRLRGHLSEIQDVLALGEPIGRRLDFLIQELNREANTLASKVQDDGLARAAVDLKVLIEQMREQVQNLE